MEGGIYLVTLNNDNLMSTQAQDRRYDDKKPLHVNKNNCKVGKAQNFNGRMRLGYYRTFGEENVNFIPVVALDADDIVKAEKKIKKRLARWRIKSPSNKLTEWTQGIDSEDIKNIIISTVQEMGIPYEVIPSTADTD